MKIYIASDHAGLNLKEVLVKFLKELNYDVVDKCPFVLDLNDDYPDFISLVAKEVSSDPSTKGIILGGSGQGEAIVANRFPNVRASVFFGNNFNMVKITREHNDSNILSLGARFIKVEDAKKAVKIWLETPFTGEERHVRRIKKIETYPN